MKTQMEIVMSYRRLPTKNYHVYGWEGKRAQTRKVRENREYCFNRGSGPASLLAMFLRPLLEAKHYDPAILSIHIDSTPVRGRFAPKPTLTATNADAGVQERMLRDLRSCFALAMIELEQFYKEI
jgi:hypothetical protein